jgi:NADH:ubiquinone reductase (H+-translocating)
VKVGAGLTPPGSDDVFVIGDTALVLDANGEALPGLAPVAKQEGAYVAEVIKARLAGRTHAPHFRYRERGKLATIGRRAAIIALACLVDLGHRPHLFPGQPSQSADRGNAMALVLRHF